MKPYSVAVPIRVVLAEDNYLVREGVRQLIDAQPELQVVAVCTDFDSLLAAVGHLANGGDQLLDVGDALL